MSNENPPLIDNLKGEIINGHLLEIIKDAGDKALDIRSKGLHAEIKSSKEDILTEGDKAVTDILKRALSSEFPGISYLDEESSETHDLVIKNIT